MMRKFSAIVICALYIGCAGTPSDSVIVVENGRAKSVIVTANEPTEAAKQGAEELQMWLKKITGAALPLKSESQIEENTRQSLILIGDTRRTHALGIDSETFELEEFVIRTFPRVLVIVGDDERPDGVTLTGTLLAVETFADEILGVKLLWPGELGEVVSKQTTIELKDISIRHKPLLRLRRIRNIGHNSRLQRQLDILGWQSEEFVSFLTESELWFRFQRFGGSFRGQYGHAYLDYWERFHRDHPDWFAFQPDGTRDNSRAEEGRRARLCVSNEGLIEQIASECIEKLRNDPTLDSASISPNDGGTATFCLCEQCKAMDAPDGEMISFWGPDGAITHVSLTDRFVTFYSAIAEIVAEELPDRYLGAYAYSAYSLPPVHAKLHPNVIIGFVPRPRTYLNDDVREEALDSWLKWSEASSQLFLRPNVLMAGHNFPTIFPHRLADDMRFFADHKMMFTDFDCCYHNWSTLGLNYYVLAGLIWDPYRDVDEIIDEYCQAGFGPAAVPIRTYFDRLEAITYEIAAGRDLIRWRVNPEVIAGHYPDDVLTVLHSLLDDADSLAGRNELIKERINFLRTGLEYVPISRDYILAKAAAREGGNEEKRKFARAKEKRIAWFQKLGYSWALSVPSLMYHDF